MALARAPFLVPGQGLQLSPQAELTAGFGQQPAQLHGGLLAQLGRFGTAAVGEQIQHGAISPAARDGQKHQRLQDQKEQSQRRRRLDLDLRLNQIICPWREA